jgi:DNA-binding transcriptional ArsR family regulator
VRFHLRKLAQAEYVAPAGPSYVPLGLIEPDDVALFGTLASEPARRLLAAVYASAGLPVGELARVSGMSRTAVASLLDAFERFRLVSRVADGRFVRVYPTRALEEKRDRHRPRARHFCEGVLRRLEAEGEAPEVLRRTPTELQVRFGRGPAKATLQLALDPYPPLLL